MKKLIFKLSYILVGLVLLASCEANDIPTIGDDDPILAQFSTTELVLATPEEGIMREVEVIVSSTSSQDRNLNVEIDPSSTATADQFSVSDLVIPADSYTGTFTISGNFDALPEGGSSSLILNLTGMEGEDIIIENGTLEVELFRRCSITLDQLVGTWEGTTAWGYETEVETWLNDDGQLMINGLTFGWFQDWWDEVIVTNQPVQVDVNLETFEITIPEQPYITSTYNGAPQPAYSLRGTGEIVNSCERIIEIRPVLVQDGVGIDGSAYGPMFVERIQLVSSDSDNDTDTTEGEGED